MSNEIADSGQPLVTDSQPEAPNAQIPAPGPGSARVPTTAQDPACGPPGGEEGPPVPDEGPPGPAVGVWCAQCAANVVPAVPDHCPVCGGWVFGNDGHVSHGLRSKKLAKQVDAYRVDLIEQMFAERGGRERLGVVGRIQIENFALLCAQAKTIETRLDQDGLFTQTGRKRSAFDMLKSISETIDRLRSELPPPIARPTQEAALAAMPEGALRLAEGLLSRQVAGEVLSDRELGQLDVLESVMNGTITLPRVVREIVDPLLSETRGDDSPSSQPVVEPAAAPIVVPTTPTAEDRDAELKRTNLERWRALHPGHPEEVARRNAEATRVMYARIGKPPIF
jgi:hypothetical protein